MPKDNRNDANLNPQHWLDLIEKLGINLELIRTSRIEPNEYKALYQSIERFSVERKDIRSSWQLELLTGNSAYYPDILSTQDKPDETMMLFAAWSGSMEAVKWVYDRHPEFIIAKWSSTGRGIASFAAGNLEILEWIQSDNPSLINAITNLGGTLAHSAAYIGNVDVLAWLERTHPKLLEAKGNTGYTIAHTAASRGKISVLTWIEYTHPDLLDAKNNFGGTIAHSCSVSDANGVETLEWLRLHRPELLDIIDKNESTIAHTAAQHGTFELLKWCAEHYPRFLGQKNIRGELPVHLSALSSVDSQEKLELILRLQEAPWEEKTEFGQTIAFGAAQVGNVNILDFILTRKPELLNAIDTTGFNIAHMAAQMGQVDVLGWILNHKPELLDVGTKSGVTIAHVTVSIQGVKTEVWKWLKTHKPNLLKSKSLEGVSIAHFAASRGNIEALQWIETFEPELLIMKDNFGCSILHTAAVKGHGNIIDHLLREHPQFAKQLWLNTINGHPLQVYARLDMNPKPNQIRDKALYDAMIHLGDGVTTPNEIELLNAFRNELEQYLLTDRSDEVKRLIERIKSSPAVFQALLPDFIKKLKDRELNLNDALNVERVLHYAPPPMIVHSKIKEPPADWLAQLEAMCCKLNPSLVNPLQKHIGENATYTLKKELLDQLKLIYQRLSGDLDSQLGKLSENARSGILMKLIEDVRECTAGFHNRVHSIIASMKQPSSLAELLTKVRQSMVENVGASLTGEVHAWNKVTRLAKLNGYGVSVNFDSDPYAGNLNDDKVLSALKKAFESKVTPFTLPILLGDELRGLMAGLGYVGRKEGEKDDDRTYDISEAKAMAALTQRCLVNPNAESAGDAVKAAAPKGDWYTPYFMIESDEDEICQYIRDINWPKIHRLFFEALSQEGYFKSQPAAKELWEWPIFNPLEFLIPKAEALVTLEYRGYHDPGSQFKELKSMNPAVYQQLIQHNRIVQSMHELITSVTAQPLKPSLSDITEIFYLASCMSIDTVNPYAQALENLLKNGVKPGFSGDLLRALKHIPPNLWDTLFNILDDQAIRMSIPTYKELIFILIVLPNNHWTTLFKSIGEDGLFRIFSEGNNFHKFLSDPMIANKLLVLESLSASLLKKIIKDTVEFASVLGVLKSTEKLLLINALGHEKLKQLIPSLYVFDNITAIVTPSVGFFTREGLVYEMLFNTLSAEHVRILFENADQLILYAGRLAEVGKAAPFLEKIGADRLAELINSRNQLTQLEGMLQPNERGILQAAALKQTSSSAPQRIPYVSKGSLFCFGHVQEDVSSRHLTSKVIMHDQRVIHPVMQPELLTAIQALDQPVRDVLLKNEVSRRGVARLVNSAHITLPQLTNLYVRNPSFLTEALSESFELVSLFDKANISLDIFFNFEPQLRKTLTIYSTRVTQVVCEGHVSVEQLSYLSVMMSKCGGLLAPYIDHLTHPACLQALREKVTNLERLSRLTPSELRQANETGDYPRRVPILGMD